MKQRCAPPAGLAGIAGSVFALSEHVCALLIEIWARRRAGESQLEQPSAQWQQTEIPESIGFDGYMAGQVPYDPNSLLGNPTLLTRLKAASLDGDNINKWDTFS